MIENNYSLRGLTLTNFEHSWESEDTKKLFVALQKNVHLQELNLGGCLDGSDTFLDLKKQERFLKSWKVTSSVPFTIEKHERTPSPQQTEPSKIPSPSFCTPKFARVLLCGHPDSGMYNLSVMQALLENTCIVSIEESSVCLYLQSLGQVVEACNVFL